MSKSGRFVSGTKSGRVSLLGLLLHSSGSSMVGIGSALFSMLSLLLAPLRIVLLNYVCPGSILAKNKCELYYRSLAWNRTINLAYLGDLVKLSGHTRSLCACFWNERRLSRIFRKARLKFNLFAEFGAPYPKRRGEFFPTLTLSKNLIFVFGLTRSGEIFTVNRYAA